MLKESMAKYNPEKWRQARADYRSSKFSKIEPPSWITFDYTTEPDDWGDLTWIGKFTDSWEPGAIKHSDRPREYRWFVPENSAEDTYGYLHAHGYSKQVAREIASRQAQEDYKLAIAAEPVVVIVNMYMSGEKVDTASLGGVILGRDYKANQLHIQEVVNDLQQDLLYQYHWMITPSYAYA